MIIPHKNNNGKYSNAKTGYYFPLNPEKYIAENKTIIFKSTLEQRLMLYLDKNPAVISWAYEKFPIKYIDKSSYPEKVRRYYIDFIAKIKSGNTIKTVWIEVKSQKEVDRPKNKNNIKDNLLWLKNQCKWQAAKLLAKQYNAEFVIITEKQLKI